MDDQNKPLDPTAAPGGVTPTPVVPTDTTTVPAVDAPAPMGTPEPAPMGAPAPTTEVPPVEEKPEETGGMPPTGAPPAAPTV